MASARLLLGLLVFAIPVAFFAGRASVGTGQVAAKAASVTRPDGARDVGAKPKIQDAVSSRLTKIAESATARRADSRTGAAASPPVGSAAPLAAPVPTTQAAPAAAPLPPERLLEDMLDKSTAGVFVSEVSQGHELAQKEQIDPDWGPTSNQELSDLLKSQLGDRFDIPTINCRTDICEIMAASKIGGSPNEDMQEFQRIPQLLRQQPWFSGSGFDLANTPMMFGSSPPDERVLVIMYITRK